MKKILAAVVALAIISCFLIPLVTAATTVTGTFTPQSTVAINVNNTSPGFGNVNVGENGTISNINITNFGDTACTVVTTAEEGMIDWDLVAGTTNPTGVNEFCVNMFNRSGYGSNWYDIQAEKSVTKKLNVTGVNWTLYDLKVMVGTNTDQGTPAEQTFYANLTAAAIT